MFYLINNLKTFLFCILLGSMPLTTFASMQCSHLHSHSYAKQLSCLKSELVAADMLLNNTFKTLMAKVADVPANQTLLRAAQKSWIKFRNEDCDFGAITPSGPGGHNSVSALSCKLERTKERAEQLNNMIECPPHYFFCPMS